ncbi:hypothetical protein ACFLXQ_05265 [Chloroflexota bacterium]
MRKSVFFVIALLIATILACDFSASTANINDAKMTKDSEGKQSTAIFALDDTFYAIVEVANAPDDTKVKAVWMVVEADGVDPVVIGEKELEGGGTLTFSVSNNDDKLWPAGKYKVDLYLNDELDRSLEFKVEGQAVAEEPTDTPEPEPTDTPEPEPTDTPEPEPTDTPESSDDSTGDTIEQPTEEAAGEEVEPLPFQAEPYVHPSGAFAFSIPQGWEVSSEDETSVTVGAVDTIANFSSLFLDAGRKLSEAEVEEFSEQMVDAFTAGGDYEVLASDQNEDGIYVQVAFELVGVDSIGDFFFFQQDTVLFVLSFIVVDYAEMLPTWEIIIDSYDTDLAAAKSSSAPADTPTPAPPPPTPTPQPATNQYAPPPGGARVYLVNSFASEFNIDFGDGAGSIQVPSGTKEQYHDIAPGSYKPGLSIAGGNAVNVDISVGVDQSWVIMVDEGGSIRSGQVYP